MKFQLLFFLGIIFNGCAPKVKNDREPKLVDHFNFKYKSYIDSVVMLNFKSFSVFAITSIRLNDKAVLHLTPVYYSEYIKDRGIPLSSFCVSERIFFVYTGLEEIIQADDIMRLKYKKQFDSACLKNDIGELKATFDFPDKFILIDNDSLSESSIPDLRDVFYDIRQVQPYFKTH
jgi:hypothetical protein